MIKKKTIAILLLVPITLIIFAILFLQLTLGLGIYLPAGSVSFGKGVRIKRYRMDYLGHTAWKEKLYFKDEVLCEFWASHYMLSPTNSELILYSCAGDPEHNQKMGSYLYDAKSKTNFFIYDDLWLPDYDPSRMWSPDGRYVVLDPNELLYLLDTKMYAVVDLSDRVFSSAEKMNLIFKGWSPDGKHLAFVLEGPHEEPVFPQQDLFYTSVDDFKAHYVASMSDRAKGLNWCWQEGEYHWETQEGGEVVLGVVEKTADGATILRKNVNARPQGNESGR